MILLPRTLPPDVRALFAKQLEDIPLDAAVDRISGIVLRLFNARDLLFFLHRPRLDAKNPVFTSVMSVKEDLPKSALENFAERWREAKIDDAVSRTLDTRLCAASYSAFAWPFPTISGEHGLSLPRDFTLLIPVSSELSVTHEQEPHFLGYFALFFDAFPPLTENLIQMIVTLPTVLSDIILSYIRFEARDGAGELSSFAHDLKRSLLLAEEQLRQLREAGGLPDEEAFYRLDRSIKRMLQQTSAVLLADRAQFQNLRISSLPMSINEVVNETTASFRSQFEHSKVELRIELAENLPLSSIDPAVFPTVLENLLENSLKFSKSGGCVLVRTKQAADAKVRLEVLDNGCGVPDKDWENIFRKHFRAAEDGPEGNGLGLYLVRKIVEAHHGRVYPERSDEMKTCFVIELPALERS